MAQALAVVVQEMEGTRRQHLIAMTRQYSDVRVCCVARPMHRDDRAAPIYPTDDFSDTRECAAA